MAGMQPRARHILLNLLILAVPAGFITVFFLVPIATMLWLGVANADVGRSLAQTRKAISEWDGSALPSIEVAGALVDDLKATDDRAIQLLARRLNTVVPGFQSLIMKTKPQTQEFLIDKTQVVGGMDRIDSRWREPKYWAGLRRISGNPTDFYLLAALDLERDVGWAFKSTATPLYRQVIWRTAVISALVSVFCLMLGYPVACWLSTLPERKARLALVLILVPFWTSLLVRSMAWLILLDDNGLLNRSGMSLGLIRHPLSLIRNRTGVLIAMTQILLPFMILSLYNVMRTIPSDLMRAGRSLGAAPLYALWRIYLPLSLPGVVAGAFIVFTLSLGYYITPLMIGGPGDQMLSYFISIFVNQTVNWSMAAALSLILLLLTAGITLILHRLVGLRILIGPSTR